MSEFDAVIVGAGPNGLVAAITLAQHGQRVLVLEANQTPGGGARSETLMRPDVTHDVCSAIHPLAVGSPVMRALPLAEHGLRWIHPEIPLAHPLDGATAAVLDRSLDLTAAGLGHDGEAYRRLFAPLLRAGFELTDSLLAPLTMPPRHPLTLARYGLHGLGSADRLARRRFESDRAQGLFAGLAAHSILSLKAPSTAGYGLMLGLLGHLVGWPMAAGGTQAITDAMVSLLTSLGGRVECNRWIASLDELPSADSVLLDLTPRQVLAVTGERLPQRYQRALRRFRYGPGVFKMDWVLDGPIPWTAPECSRSATVHLGGTLAEIVTAEHAVQQGAHPDRPFVLVTQPTLFDTHRAPPGVHTAWAYCHVPNGSTVDISARIEAQLERFAPGFRDRVTHRHVMATPAMQAHDANYIGGDIGGGVADLRQFIARPTWGLHPWRTPVKGLWLCSSSTPPGAGVHGMCGYHAAHDVLRRSL